MSLRFNLNVEQFLAENWQRKALFLPQGITDFMPPADANELAGLALDEAVDSRIIMERSGSWCQETGPFRERALQRQGAWTLLVQSVEQYWDEAAELLRLVDWLPSWRLDNVMMSYASDGGSAGPHFDYYDVFIIQGEGQRLWQLGQHCTETTPLLAHDELSLLQDFEVSAEHLMSCGDVLYIPPGIAHYGISRGESTSFSLGFRAPRLSDLLARWTDQSLESLTNQQLLCDAGRVRALRAGELTRGDLDGARAQVLKMLQQSDSRWMGEALTSMSSVCAGSEPVSRPEGTAWSICREPSSRIAWYSNDSDITVFANGDSLNIPQSLRNIIETLCADRAVIAQDILDADPRGRDLLNWLCDEGAILIHG